MRSGCREEVRPPMSRDRRGRGHVPGQFYVKGSTMSYRQRHDRGISTRVPRLKSNVRSTSDPLQEATCYLSMERGGDEGKRTLLDPSFLLSICSFNVCVVTEGFQSCSENQI